MGCGMRARELEDYLICILDKQFQSAVSDYVISDKSDDPHTRLHLEATLYDFLVLDVLVERGAIFFALCESSIKIRLFNVPLSDLGMIERAPLRLDSEVRLRIPDKYLVAKGWG